MVSKTKPTSEGETSEDKYTKLQRGTLIVCAIIMVAYVVLAHFITQGSFWTFATAHIVLAAIAIIFIWLGRAPKVMKYTALSVSLLGALTALALMLYYLTILSSLANG